MTLLEWIDLPAISDVRGTLVVIEAGSTTAFDIKRAYYLIGTSHDVSRGFHAHRALQQLAICVSGSCRMVLDNGASREEAILDAPHRGLLIREMIWHEMHDFSPDSVLLVLASAHYDERDYIRDYSIFREII